ncbi:MAG: aminodeoxychorismate/anthranilate synthase component II [Microscillaceae bacterium]|nr:aminodeoxychorismate/anthranilate synthase component II [Microscillaceae bacterium]
MKAGHLQAQDKSQILVIDNYDSFVYNLVHYLRDLGQHPVVRRNDKIALEEVAAFDRILLSPGPGLPQEAGIMPALLQQYASSKSILGVCLGHQAIGEAFGGTLVNLPQVLHGLASQTTVLDQEDVFFRGLPLSFKVAHYHSWVVEEASIQGRLIVTARDENGLVMALRHPQYRVWGVQFHPESVLTEHGKQMLQNWLAS